MDLFCSNYLLKDIGYDQVDPSIAGTGFFQDYAVDCLYTIVADTQPSTESIVRLICSKAKQIYYSK